MNTNFVFVLDSDKRPLAPCHPARARELLAKGKAAVFRRFPLVIILTRSAPDAAPQPCQVKLDPGSKTTGIALVQGDKVIWGGEITHRGGLIKKKLDSRRASRRLRRSRLRYRAPRFLNRTRSKGWLAPSLQHRVQTTLTWVNRLIRFAPVGELTQELVKFNRKQLGWDKAHWLDAAATGTIGALRLATAQPLLVTCKGQGGRQKAVLDRYGYPKQHRSLKPIMGWRSGDIARCEGQIGRISPRQTGSFEMRPFNGGKPFSRPARTFRALHRNDGYAYAIGNGS